MKAVLPERPYPAQGMSPEAWLLHGEVQVVRLDELVGTQTKLSLEVLLGIREPQATDPLLHVVWWRGVTYLDNGHVRATRLLLQGEHTALARVIELDDEGKRR